MRMPNTRKPKVLAIVGPTSSGKSDLAVLIAKKINGEVISADSRQVYKGLDIGTGKVPKDKSKFKNQKSKIKNPQTDCFYYKGIRHHLLDVVSPKRQFTVAEYQKLARKTIADITKHGKLPILCGGTGLYVDATLYDLPIPSVKPDKVLRKKLEALSAEKLFEILKLKDPRRARHIDRHNKRRLIRALEIVATTGKVVPPLDEYYAHPRYNILKIGITVRPEKLKEKIYARLKARMRQGMIREVRELLAHKETTPKRLEELGLEYRYIGRYLSLRPSSGQARKIAKQEMVAKLEKEIWRYAKRQMTWFKRDPTTHWAQGRKTTQTIPGFYEKTRNRPSHAREEYVSLFPAW